MEDDYMEMQDPSMNDMNRSGDGGDAGDMKDYNEGMYEEGYEEDDGGNNFRANRGRGSFRSRGRGPPMGWMNGPPMRFRGRGYGPGGPPMRGRGFFRGRGGPRFGPNGGPPNFDNNWGPMGPPPPGMMGGPPPFGPPPGMMPPGGPMGPPPNMMGQPPPFGGPPGIPPPNMPAPEFWVEAKTDEGKAYYYHARTRETTWTRPQETPTLKVISQGEVEAMVAAGFPSGQVTNITVPPQTLAALNGNMQGPMGGPPMGMMPNGMMGGMMPPQNAQQQGAVPPYMGQQMPWIKEGQYDANKEKPEDISQEGDDVPPGETMAIMQNTNNNMGGGYPVAGPGYNVGGPFPGGNQQPQQQQQVPPQQQQQQQQQQQGGYPAGGQQGGGPGPASAGYGSWGGWGGGWPPQMVSQPPPNMAPQQMGENGGQTQMSTMPNDMQQQQQQQQPPQQQQQQIGGQVQSQPQHSQTFPPPKPLKQGKHTTISPELYAKASEWTSHKSPDGRFYYYNSARKESVWEKPKVLREYEELELKIAIENGERKIETIVIDDKPDEVDLLQAEEAAKAEIERQAAAELAEEKAREAAAEQEKLEREKAEKEKQEKEAAQKEKLKQDKRLPVSTIAISGTPWCVVWTGDGRVFFHNPTALSSVWERPAQLIGRADVDKAVSTPPPMLAETMRKENKATAAVTSTSEASTSDSKSNGDLKRSADPSESDSDAEPPKKAKPDDNKKTSGTIDVGKEAAIEAEVRAARERGVVPHEQRLRSFQQMLHEKDVSAFSTWEKELHKIVFDPRYLMLNSKERRQVFDQYVRERAEEERKEKKSRLQQKKMAFKQLLDEAKLHSKSSYTEFSAKHGRDERFKAIEKPRDRENYFNEHIADVRRREKEEKEKKREQAKMDFIALLKEKAIDRHTRWLEAKKKIDTDPRYKAVEASGLKEDYFREYCKMVKEGKKKEKEGKEKDRSKKEKKDKDRDKESKREKKKEKAEKHTEQASEEVPKQPTPPPDQWADILGIPGGENSNTKQKTKTKKSKTGVVRTQQTSDSSDEELLSPKQLRSCRKDSAAASSPVLLPTAVQVSDSEPLKLIIKSPPKKRKFDSFFCPEPEEKKKKSKRRESTKSLRAEKIDEVQNDDGNVDDNAENVETNIQEAQLAVVKVAKPERKKRKKTEKQ